VTSVRWIYVGVTFVQHRKKILEIVNEQADSKKEKKDKKKDDKRKMEDLGRSDEKLPGSLKFILIESKINKIRHQQFEISQNVSIHSNLTKVETSLLSELDRFALADALRSGEAAWIDAQVLELDTMASLDRTPNVVILFFKQGALINPISIVRLLSAKGSTTILSCMAGVSEGSLYNCMDKASRCDLRRGISQLFSLRSFGFEVILYGRDVCFTG
jgi:hypothetical protein